MILISCVLCAVCEDRDTAGFSEITCLSPYNLKDILFQINFTPLSLSIIFVLLKGSDHNNSKLLFGCWRLGHLANGFKLLKLY